MPCGSSMEKPLQVQEIKRAQYPSSAQSNHGHSFLPNVDAGFSALLKTFKYLELCDLMNVAKVSKTWRHIASHSTLWKTVRMKNTRVRDWRGLGRVLKIYKTKALDLKNMYLPETQDGINKMWTKLSQALAKDPRLKEINFGKCTDQGINSVTSMCPQLESIVSLSLRGTELDLMCVANCKNLKVLEFKCRAGIEVKNIAVINNFASLKKLSLLGVKNIKGIEDVLSESLETLELGDCTGLSERFPNESLLKLVCLKKLRLEKCQMSCPTIPILNSISGLPKLTELELINFDVIPGFDKALAKCKNIQILLLIPTYDTKIAFTTRLVMDGVSHLSSTLVHFIWVLTLEMLRVFDLFIDQQFDMTGKMPKPELRGNEIGNRIPMLKSAGDRNCQVDILGIPTLGIVFSKYLPKTKVDILKVPARATWRQTVQSISKL